MDEQELVAWWLAYFTQLEMANIAETSPGGIAKAADDARKRIETDPAYLEQARRMAQSGQQPDIPVESLPPAMVESARAIAGGPATTADDEGDDDSRRDANVANAGSLGTVPPGSGVEPPGVIPPGMPPSTVPGGYGAVPNAPGPAGSIRDLRSSLILGATNEAALGGFLDTYDTYTHQQGLTTVGNSTGVEASKLINEQAAAGKTVSFDTGSAMGSKDMGFANPRDALLDPQRWKATEVQALQRRLYQAGFFSKDVYESKVALNWGTFDAATQTAWAALLAQGLVDADLGNGKKGRRFQGINLGEVLEQKKRNFLSTGINAAGDRVEPVGGRAEAANETHVITLTSEEEMRQVAEGIGRELLGRDPTPGEVARISKQYNEYERKLQRDRILATEKERDTKIDPMTGLPMSPANAPNPALLRDDLPTGGYQQGVTPARQLNSHQRGVVNTIAEVGREMGMSQDAIVMAISVGLVESDLTNTSKGMKDKRGDQSLGVFQQHAWETWGISPALRLDVRHAARKFFEAALRTGGKDLGEWAANIQNPRKDLRGKYGERMNEAAAIYFTYASGTGAPVQPGDHDVSERGWRPTNPRQADLIASQRQRSAGPSGPGWDGSVIGDGGVGSPLADYADSGSINFLELENMLSPSAYAEQQLRESNPGEYQAKRFSNTMDDFFSLLGGQ